MTAPSPAHEDAEEGSSSGDMARLRVATLIEVQQRALAIHAGMAAVCAHIEAYYPNVRLGGAVDRIGLATQELADLCAALDEPLLAALSELPDMAPGEDDEVPERVQRDWDAAVVIPSPPRADELARVLAAGCLVVERAPCNRSSLPAVWGLLFGQGVDPLAVKVWWPRLVDSGFAGALVEGEHPMHWLEVVSASLP